MAEPSAIRSRLGMQTGSRTGCTDIMRANV
jgi:hypothetical protein